jgi:uncharacterized membrane protein YsdA (DUF1294 family)/cold shock CspA family protein
MPQQGRLTEWNDDRGFGFISPLDGSNKVFVHVSQFPRDTRRPQVLDLLGFSTETDERGRLRASDVRFLVPAAARHREHHETVDPSMAVNALLVSGLFLGIIAVLTILAVIPPVIFVAYLILSVTSFAAYAVDKSAAQRGAWRTPESTLHLLALAGGWPGALCAQQSLRHKTIKQSFRRVFWGTVAGNCLLLVVFLLSGGGSLPG